jgi:hypothetical protein
MGRRWLRKSAVLAYPVGLSVLLAALGACSGLVSEPSGPGQGLASSADDEASDPTVRSCERQALDPGVAPLALLTHEQYLHSLRDLVGELPALDSLFGSARAPSAFGLIPSDISQVELERYQQAAALVTDSLEAAPERLRALSGCAAESDGRACARSFVQSFGARAYRVPELAGDDIARHLALYDVGAQTSHERGLSLVLRAVLQAPRFLYRVELGTSQRVSEHAVRLSGHELAARLSYVLWDTLPDQRLSQAALSGELDSEEGVLAQLDWMLDDARGKTLLTRFLERHLHVPELSALAKDAALFPRFAEAGFQSSMRGQATRFFEHVLHEGDASLSALLTSPVTFINGDLADHYGVSAGASFVPLELPGKLSGILTLPALLALTAKPDESSPIYRGKFVREALLCQQLPAPPPNIPDPPSVDQGGTTRERLRQHEVDPECSGCHRMMDPIGFGFEHFDAIGRYRTSDGGKPVDARGEVVGAGAPLDGPFDGVVELGQRLSASSEVDECLARQWFRFALGRFERDVDECTIAYVLAAFREQGQSLHALPRALVSSPAFLYRRPETAEGEP